MINWFRRKKKEAGEPEQEIKEGESALSEEQQPETIPEEPTFEPEPDEVMAKEAQVEEPTVDEGLEEGEPEDSVEYEDKGRFFRRLRERLHKTREQFVSRVDRLVLGKKTIGVDILDDLEEVLITSDLGVKTTRLLLDRVTERIRRQELKDPGRLRDSLREEIESILKVPETPWNLRAHRPGIVMMVGVNGVGKTTTIGKLAHQLKGEGLRVVLVAGDTFRAAAVEQLSLWGERIGVPVIKQKSGSDPSAVAFDAMDSAASREADVLLIDTAGRMHTKVNLMEELKKIQRVIAKKMPEAPHEILLVLDASTGQNALSQARLFKEQIGVTGLILTKLDGTAKGGIVVAICDELKLPVRYIGIGESVEDLRPFEPEEFTKALF